MQGPDLVINQKKDLLDNMDEWCKTHHAASGLTQRVLQSTISEHDAETQVLDFVKKHVGSSPPLIAGNSVYVDLLFLKVSKNCPLEVSYTSWDIDALFLLLCATQ
jgi:oligoribonuclease